ncbi:hypothetical protein CDL15_Pgr021137 [Punica granatum]|uniref:non-specific serine/threonine protein kinase n=1 Tax=Punica granatum TaxID=22663 RepID=A0A218WKR9_PUNGR|nr:hypothetical protein CDL15_Pgr021137 [Punica granatum]
MREGCEVQIAILLRQSLCLVLPRAFYVLGLSGFSRLIQIAIAQPASTNLGCLRLLINSMCMRVQLGLLQNLADNPGAALLHGQTAPYVKEVEEVESGLLRLKLAEAKFPTSISISTCFCNFFFFLLLCNFFSSSISQQWVRSGYYISRSEIPVSDIASALFTHLICSFAYINSSTFELSINSSELPKFSSFTSTVRRKNNRIITLLSVWAGGDDPAIFESMVGNSSSRQFFINSSIKAARSYGFNGLDLLLPEIHLKVYAGFLGVIKGLIQRSKCGMGSRESLESDTPNLQVFSYATLKAATNNFSAKNKLGEGGFGPVYKGKLCNGQEIAVKKLSKNSNQGLEEFKNEVMLTARLQHVNLLRVLGFCTDREEKMLIYEYMPGKSLDFYLFDPVRRYYLDWDKRLQIIEGVTQGLLYLQEYSNCTIVHRDLKASNILLDSERNPKISDFGIARIFRKNELEANTGRIRLVPPEYVRNGIYSMKYDVYSFGVLLLQIISGKKTNCRYGPSENLNLLEYAYETWISGEGMEFIDPSLVDSASSCKLTRCLQIALLCVQENPMDRPSMLEISSILRNGTSEITSPK